MKFVAVIVVALGLGCARPAPLLVERTHARTVLFKGVRVLDTVGVRWMDGTRDVLVEDGRVTRLEASISGVTADAVYEGGTLMPGLTDAHVHVFNGYDPPWRMGFPDEKRNLEAFLAAGITTVMDQGGMNFTARELGEKVARGDVVGPRILAAGPLFTAHGGHPVDAVTRLVPWWLARLVVPRMTREVSTPADVAAPMAEVLEANPDWVKIALDRAPVPSTPRLDVPTLQALVKAAHAGRKKVFVHVGRSQDALDAANAGADVLAHGVHMDALGDDALEALASRKVPVVATLSIFRAIERMGVPEKPEYSAMERRVAGDELLASFRPLPAKLDEGLKEWTLAIAANRAVTLENTRRLHARGVPILVGSDAVNAGHFPGGGLHWELDLLLEAGLTPVEVLSQAARGNLRAWGGPDDTGEVSVGKPADLFWVKGDVSVDFGAVHQVGVVLTRGRAWEPVR